MGKKGKKNKTGFLKRRQLKKEKRKQQRKKMLRKVVTPHKHLKSLSTDRIRELLEDAPYLLEEQEFADFSFNPDQVKNYTEQSMKQFDELFSTSKDKSIKKKREIYEDFCVDVVGKLINRPFLISLKRKLKSTAKRLKAEKRKEEMMRAIISEAMLNIPQVPAEAHPLIVAMYEDKRGEVYEGDFNIDGFEEIIYWKDRVALEREEDRHLKLTVADVDSLVAALRNAPDFEELAVTTDEKATRFVWKKTVDTEESETSEEDNEKPVDAEESETSEAIEVIVEILNNVLTSETAHRAQAKELRDRLEELSPGVLSEIDDDDDDDKDQENTPDEKPDESEASEESKETPADDASDSLGDETYPTTPD